MPRRDGRLLNTHTEAAVARYASVAGVLLAWEVCARVGWIDTLLISFPSEIFTAGVELLGRSEVHENLLSTGRKVGFAFLLGSVSALIAGFFIGTVPVVRRAYMSPILFLLSTPNSIFLPIVILFFGIGPNAAIVFGAFGAFLYMVINVVAGVDLLEQRHRKVALAYRANRRHMLVDVVLPAALPGVVSGLWHSARRAFSGVLVAELFISTAGAGYLVRHYSANLETDRTMAMILLLAFGAIVVGTGWTRVERRLSQWRDRTGTSVAEGTKRSTDLQESMA